MRRGPPIVRRRSAPLRKPEGELALEPELRPAGVSNEGAAIALRAPSPADTDHPTPDSVDRGENARRRQWRRIAIAAAVVAVLAAVAAGVFWRLGARDYETTGDAFIDARPSAIGA